MTQTILGGILHPEYSYMAQRWREWRLTYESGQFYIDQYLIWHEHESAKEYMDRKEMSYVPAFAKEAINEVRNSVWTRLTDVARHGGSDDYKAAVLGLDGGVDHKRSPMSDFVGRVVLPELLVMRRVGIWIDMPPIKPGATKADVQGAHPYLVWYPVESIRSWATDDDGKLTRILLKQSNFMHDEATGLPMSGSIDAFRLAWIGDPDKGEEPVVHIREETEKGVQEYKLDLDEIPFVQFEIEHSLLEDVSRHQRALLNMESADVSWCIKANFPVWTAQFDPRASSAAARPAQQRERPSLPRAGFDDVNANTPLIPAIPAGQAKEASQAKAMETAIGPTTGIGYPMGLERPGYVHPSSEPITASMAKELAIKEDIRRQVHLSVATLDPRMASAESKEMDDRGLQNGLCAIGAALQRGEQAIAHHWAAYAGDDEAIVRYPTEWTTQSDQSRRQDAEQLAKLIDKVPSRTCQREVAKQVANKLVGHKVAPDVLDQIHEEIDAAQFITSDVDSLKNDIEMRLVSAKFASEEIRGYPAGEVDKALEEQAKQLAIVAISQSQGAGAARGVPGAVGDKSSADEKKLAASQRGVPEDQSRGFGDGAEPLGSSPASPVAEQN